MPWPKKGGGKGRRPKKGPKKAEPRHHLQHGAKPAGHHLHRPEGK